MESKEIKIERAMYRFYHKVGLWLMLLLLVALVLLELTSCRSTTAACGTQRTIRDSVVVKYKTVLRDSLRIKDSTVVSFFTVQRDSVVLRVDAETGRVVGKDTWHWRDNEASREHFGDTQRTASKEDSLSSASVRTDSIRVPVPVERKLSKWERICRPVKDMLSILGAIAMAVVITWIVVEVRDWARGKI